MIVRLDRGTAVARYRVTVARVGPLSYEDGTTEHVPIETLRTSAASLVGKPVTVDHPPGGRLDPTPDEIVGRVIEAHVDAEELVATIEITDRRVIEAIDVGHLTELSPGYRADVDLYEDGLVQTRREYHHLAIGPSGWSRCGGACSVDARTDAICTCGCAPLRSPAMNSKIDRSDPPVTAYAARQKHAEWSRTAWQRPSRFDAAPSSPPPEKPDPNDGNVSEELYDKSARSMSDFIERDRRAHDEAQPPAITAEEARRKHADWSRNAWRGGESRR